MPSHLQPPLWRRAAPGSLDAVFAPAQSRGTTLHELLGAIAHEIRSPLTLLRGEAALMRRKSADPDAVREASAAIDRQVSQIAGFLQDLVALAEDAEAIQPPRRRIAVSELLANARRGLGEVFDERLARVTIGKPAPTAIVDGDPDRLERALRAMLVMLATAAALRGEVVLHVASDGDDVVISLASRGAQIAADLLPTLFDPFVRALYGLRGEGVSLAAARRAVTAHGGSIKVQSTDDGTEFIVRLPRAPT
jgi:signal transduction histidine kinase